MKFDVNVILDGRLKEFSPVLYSSSDSIFMFSNIKFWDGKPEEDSIYIAEASQLADEPPEWPRTLHFFVIKDVEIPLRYLDHPKIKIVALEDKLSTTGLFNILNDCFLQLPRYSLRLTNLIDAIVDGNYSNIIEIISHTVDHSVALLSNGLKLLDSYKAAGEPQSPVWSAMHKNGYHPAYNLKTQLATGKIMARDPKSRQVELLSDYTKASGEVFCPIIADRKSTEVLGYLFFEFNDQETVLENTAALEYMCHLMSWYFWRYTNMTQSGYTMLSVTMNKILTGSIREESAIQRVLVKSGFKPKRYMRLVVIESHDPEVSKANSQEALQYVFGELWPAEYEFLCRNKIVFLLRSNELPVIAPEDYRRLQKKLEDYNCLAGISDVFEQIDRSLYHQFYRTTTAISCGSQKYPDRRIFKYKDIALIHLVQQSTENSNTITRALVDPRLVNLVESDRCNGTDFLMTLRYYWYYNKNAKEICNRLHLHKSTLYSKLDKIRELLGCDVSDYREYAQLSVGIEILEDLGDISTFDFGLNTEIQSTELK